MTANATGDVNSVWKIDANFTSSTCSSLLNNTADAIIRIIGSVVGGPTSWVWMGPEVGDLVPSGDPLNWMWESKAVELTP